MYKTLMGQQQRYNVSEFEYLNQLLPHLVLQQGDLTKKFPRMEMKLLILKILNHKITEIKQIPPQFQATICSKMMQEDLSEEDCTRSYSFLIDESNKSKSLNKDVSSTVYQ